MSFLGVYREALCSPGRHRENDAAILELAAEQLESRGHRVALATGDEAAAAGRDASVVFSMSRSPACLDLLERWEREGKTVVNRPNAVLDTARHRLAQRTFRGVTLPATRVVATLRDRRGAVTDVFSGPGQWVKGGELFSSRREDVQRVESSEALDRVLDDFERRGIATAVLQDHVAGREIKFYAVARTRFFHWLGADEAAARVPSHAFQQAAIDAGSSVGLEIFGGDIVLCDDGRIVLIDLNDWPSFAPCPEPAARAIADYLESRLTEAYAVASPAGFTPPSV
jgi:glutathione synthase/RimK-type ligase-like ATP-grasp enzyme